MPPPTSKPTVVSPTFTSAGSGSAEKEKAPARNPFAVVSSGHTPQKRKNVFDGIQDMKASPSPKKPTLNVRSFLFPSFHLFYSPLHGVPLLNFPFRLFSIYSTAPEFILTTGAPAKTERQANSVNEKGSSKLVKYSLECGIYCVCKVFNECVCAVKL